MGCVTLRTTFPACEKASLLQQYAELAASDREEYGSGGYTGTWAEPHGIEVHSLSFPTEAAADAWLDSRAEKWGPALAVRAGLITPEPKSLVLLRQRTTQAGAALKGFDAEVLNRIRKGKQALRSCPACQSKLAVKYLQRLSCPVCGRATLATETDLARKAALQKRRDKLVASLAAAEKKHPAGWFWLVGAEAAA